jgi:hypothetical protein
MFNVLVFLAIAANLFYNLPVQYNNYTNTSGIVDITLDAKMD